MKPLFIRLGIGVFCATLLVSASAETIPLAQAPPAVQKRVQDLEKIGKLGEIEREEEDGVATYTIEIIKGDDTRDYVLSEGGRFLRVGVFPRELSATVQIAVQKIAGQGTIESIDKVLDEEPEHYDVVWKTKDGTPFSFSVLESGALKNVQITPSQTPVAVEAAIVRETGGGKLATIVKSFDDDGVTYVATINRDGQDRELTFTESGHLVRLDMLLPETPPTVQKTIQTLIGESIFASIDKVLEDGQWHYEVDWKTKDGTKHSGSVLENGKMKSLQMALAETPPAVNTAILREAGGGKIKGIVKSFEDGVVSYDVTVNRNGKDRDFTVAENGDFMHADAFFPESPAAVQKTIQGFIKQGTIASMAKELDDGKMHYHVDWKAKDGVTHSFSVLESGKLEGVTVTLAETSPAVSAAILQEAGAGQLKEIVKSFDEDSVDYDVTITRDGRDRDFTVSDSGQLERRQVFLWELPYQPQSAIQRVTGYGTGTILRIDEGLEKKKGAFPYEVESLVDGKRYDFSVSRKGEFLSVDP